MSDESEIIRPKVQWIEVTEENSGQRLDNFLLARLKGVPKSRIYRIVRKGEVRINKGRCQPKQRLVTGDIVRIPPVRVAQREKHNFVPPRLEIHLRQNILFEDESMLIINKPSGFAVHGGTGINTGIIEALRSMRPEAKFLELVHRLDKDTSGCLIIAKKRTSLTYLHELFRTNQVNKTYLALLSGLWQRKKLLVTEPLQKNIQKGGERMVVVSQSGKTAETFFRRLQKLEHATLVEASPKTGRTHQIRVHAAWMGHPIVGDDRYGNMETNGLFKSKGYKRLMLHAEKLEMKHPETEQVMSITAPIPDDFNDFLDFPRKKQLFTGS
jgi:23S rRNA pseudouridine955/2504/2580 synthase